jgi:hypothetical protein
VFSSLTFFLISCAAHGLPLYQSKIILLNLMNITRKFIWLLIIPLMAFGLHEHYISLTKIDFLKEKSSVQITMRFFIDDVEKALENQFELPLELATKNENKQANQYLETYIREQFKINLNQREESYTYLGKEYEDDVVYIYLEIENVDDINTVEVQNSMLIDTFEDQQNYVKISIGKVQKTFILIKANDKEMLKL